MRKYLGPEKAVLFTGALYSSPAFLDTAIPVLTKVFGDILFMSPSLPWNYTSYYSDEMGSPLYRSFIFFNGVIDPVFLVDAKLMTNEIEARFSEDDKRRINLDPGYLTLAKVVLASTKNYSHRISIGKGIYAEMALLFRHGSFVPLPYCYRDYQDMTFRDIFMEAREQVKDLLIASP